MSENSFLSQIVERASEGIIAIDREQRISLINKRAKEIFGLSYTYDIGHPAGRLEEGDIIVIGDNSLGTDDGGMSTRDLELLDIQEGIKEKAAFVYIGMFGEKGNYKFCEPRQSNKLSMQRKLLDKDISVSIDFLTKQIEINIDGLYIPYSFITGIGHLVILNGTTGELKFYQSRGYTVRGEDLKAILSGRSFTEKICGKYSELDVLGENIANVIKTSESLDYLIEVSEGKSASYEKRFDDINGRPIRCSIYPLMDGDMHSGAYLKFEDLSDLKRITDERDSIQKKLREIEDSVYDPFNTLIGESQGLKEVKEYSKKAALSTSNILILGESGTGKSVLANIIHNYSSRNRNRFVEINCGALSESILESELFGYVSGAFTGAKKEGKTGLIEYADGGTLFLDEISEMSLSIQVKLLHVIQNKSFIPVGGTEVKKVDIRLLCATNRELKKMVSEGSFREDLFYRINVIPINLPPLRERKEDLHYLIQGIIQKIIRRDKLSYKTLSNEAFNKLYAYNFPGNVRELENIIERSLNISEGQIITEEDILLEAETSDAVKPLKLIIEETEKRTIQNYMKRFNGNKTKVMEALGLKKTSFYEKLNKYNIE